MTSVNPAMESESCSCKWRFSAHVLRSTRSNESFCCIARFNSRVNLSNTTHLSKRGSGSVGAAAAMPAATVCTGNTCRNTDVMEMCFRAWKKRIVNAIKSRTVLDGAAKQKLLDSFITSWNLTMSKVWMITLGYSCEYSATTSRPWLPWVLATRTQSVDTLMDNSRLPEDDVPSRICVTAKRCPPRPTALSRLRLVEGSNSKGPISPRATPKRPSSKSAGCASTRTSVPMSSAEIWYMFDVTPMISTGTSPTRRFQRHLNGTGRPVGDSAAATSTPV
mmetsp:Transcript_34577/g.98356  ORF Transcript_34577/g.98356 Transcript_34577/m.98356 type:complete len:277 (-) Transcript_34577:271-1101(-)